MMEKTLSENGNQYFSETKMIILPKHATSFDIYMLGIAVVIGGQVFSWNGALLGGFWEAFLGMILTGLGYLCLVLCLAEMTSALPFSGGSYGFVRVCVGPFFGYMVGCCEALQNMAYVVSSVIPLGQLMTLVTVGPVSYEPLYWTIFFVTAIGINIAGGKLFWNFVRVIGMVSLLLILLYIASTSQYGDFNRNTNSAVGSYSFSMTNFMEMLPVSSWYFIGVESLPLACVDCEKPSSQIPFGMLYCVLTLLATAIGVFFTATSQSPGTDEVGNSLSPLSFGYDRVFGLSDVQSTWLAIPASYATGFGFMFVYGRQMCSMARSGLFPTIFKHRTSFSNTPYVALIFGSTLTVVGVLSIYYTNLSLLTEVFSICILASYSVYIFAFLSYISFKRRYTTLARQFINPLGIPSAVFGMIVYSTGLVSVLGFQIDRTIPITFFVIYLTIAMLYYLFFGYKKQQLCEEEQKVLFRAYVINANMKSRVKKHQKPFESTFSVRSRGTNQSRVHPSLKDYDETPSSASAFNTEVETIADRSESDIPSKDLEIGGTDHNISTDPYDDCLDRRILPIKENEETVHPSTDPHQHREERSSQRVFHISESVKALADDLQLLPFMESNKRTSYEELVLSEYITGEYQ